MKCTEMKYYMANCMKFTAINDGDRYGNEKQGLMIMWVNKWNLRRCKTKRPTIWDLQQRKMESDMKMINKLWW